MIEVMDMIADVFLEVAEQVIIKAGAVVIAIGMILSAPIWLVPYIVYRENKKKKEDG